MFITAIRHCTIFSPTAPKRNELRLRRCHIIQSTSKSELDASKTQEGQAIKQELYERIGGEPAVEKTVDILYARILSDPELIPFFEGVDMARQKQKQADFVTYAFGGRPEYPGKSLEAAHRRLKHEMGLGDRHFCLVAQHLAAAMKEAGVSGDMVKEAMGIVAQTRHMFSDDD